MSFMDARVVSLLLGEHDRCVLEQVFASLPNHVFRPTKSGALSLLSAGLGSATTASAEARLQAVDEVADDGENEHEDDDDDRDGDVAGHFGGWWWKVIWVGRLINGFRGLRLGLGLYCFCVLDEWSDR
jgi:hypothetical protein